MRPRILAIALLALACGQATPESEPGMEAEPPAQVDAEPGEAEAVTAAAVEPPELAAGVDPVVRRFVERVGQDVLMRWGACPFECCVYREWLAESEIPVLSEPRATGAVLGRIPAGAPFRADTGFVRVSSPQLVVVTAPVEAYRLEPNRPGGGDPITFAAGDSLLVLDYAGEGHYHLVHGGELFSAQQFWPGEGDWPPADQVKGEVTGEHATEWWVRVRWGDAGVGWIDAYGAEIGNADACA